MCRLLALLHRLLSVRLIQHYTGHLELFLTVTMLIYSLSSTKAMFFQLSLSLVFSIKRFLSTKQYSKHFHTITTQHKPSIQTTINQLSPFLNLKKA